MLSIGRTATLPAARADGSPERAAGHGRYLALNGSP